MTSKRNSRVYTDEAAFRADSNSANCSQRARHDSYGSVDDDASLEHGEGQRAARAARDHSSATSRAPSLTRGERDASATSANRPGDKMTSAAPVKASSVTRSPAGTFVGRPANFGVVLPGVFRSSYPQPEDYAFLQSLQLKTIVTLVNKEGGDDSLSSFVTSNGIRQIVFDMKGTKKEAIPPATMASILNVVLDRNQYPLMVHCNHGKHRTGCVVAVVRKLSGWTVNTVLDEYRAYATPKVRECDVDYISSFKASTLITSTRPPLPMATVQHRNFFRLVVFSTFIIVLWLVSGSKLGMLSGRLAAS
ncbi:tyrosine phosphatase [Ophiocordyceps camponoti-floridani]|uniref:Tyrosine phosphatase n=1 Tax=Ophiocordyceps camponoti-floridani TaxID=2030778 RepID=A0A8H4Q8S2_9HYPO|nr:tyrosine phosphatase [Ophiocordyceps camponoti-floridani]